MNVKGAKEEKINKNKQIQQLKTILGLENEKEYGNLRYGYGIIMIGQVSTEYSLSFTLKFIILHIACLLLPWQKKNLFYNHDAFILKV